MRAAPASRRDGDAADAPVLVQVRALFKEFTIGSGRVAVLRGVDLTLRQREMATIIGASGAGKSTFLHCLGTLDLPTSGSIMFEGTDITRLSPAELAAFRNRSIGFVFQFHHLLPEFSALENAMMPALIARRPTREAREAAESMLEAVGMSHRLKHRPGELSGGEQQRVAIARALVMRPKLLLADEPTGNLDTRTSAEVHDLMFRLNDEYGLTMLVVTHNMELAKQMPRVVQMADGQILDAGLGGRPHASAPAQREYAAGEVDAVPSSPSSPSSASSPGPSRADSSKPDSSRAEDAQAAQETAGEGD